MVLEVVVIVGVDGCESVVIVVIVAAGGDDG
jgi:hypothetical protein